MCSDKINQGGGVAAPIGSQIFGEVLPYLEVAKDGETEEQIQKVEVPKVEGISINEATKIIKDINLEIGLEEIEGLDKENTIVKKQTPNSGVVVNSGSKVYLEY